MGFRIVHFALELRRLATGLRITYVVVAGWQRIRWPVRSTVHTVRSRYRRELLSLYVYRACCIVRHYRCLFYLGNWGNSINLYDGTYIGEGRCSTCNLRRTILTVAKNNRIHPPSMYCVLCAPHHKLSATQQRRKKRLSID